MSGIDLASLNKAQRSAVECVDGPLLVLAGAGSGKTRVLTYRIAHLVGDCGVQPWQILAVTFTNKAAKEMRARLLDLAGPMRGMWVCTFHSMCVRILREHADKIGYTRQFTIYDADDAKRLVKEIVAELNLDAKRFPPQRFSNRISQAKNELKGADEFAASAGKHFEDSMSARVFTMYQERLVRANAMDFDDLLYNTWFLLERFPEVARLYQERFTHILVDEYQDTNRAQYAITQRLAAGHGNLMVVGDDDQSIYSWRGADIRNILDFERDWPDATTVKLEENYRSTQTILDAANAVIAHNADRKDKKLFTEGAKGEKIACYCANDERDEGRWIAGEIERLHDAGVSYDDVAVFYRTNAQSRTLEDMFLRAGVPYRLVGGTRFFDRAEIRDVMAYLKCVVNPADDISARRVINMPRRGIGKSTVERIAATAQVMGIPFLQAAREEAADPECRAGTRRGIQSFLDVVDGARELSGALSDVVQTIVERSGLMSALAAQQSDEAQGRIDNIREFFGVVADYVRDRELYADEELEAGGGEADAAATGTGGHCGRPRAGPGRLHGVAQPAHRPRLPRRRVRRLRHLHDHPLRERPGVSRGLCRRHGRGDIPAHHEPDGRRRGRGAPPGLRRHHPRTAAPLPVLRAVAAPLQHDAEQPPLALRGRDPRQPRGVQGHRQRRHVGHRLGQARRPSRHRRLGARRGDVRRARLRPHRACGRDGHAHGRTRRRRQRRAHPRADALGGGPDLCQGRQGGPQDLRAGHRHRRGRRQAHHQVLEDGRGEEALAGIRPHREGGLDCVFVKLGRLSRAHARTMAGGRAPTRYTRRVFLRKRKKPGLRHTSPFS